MKKRLSVALCVTLLLCAATVAQALTNEEVVGTWYLNEITTGGASLDPSVLGMDTTMEIAADGTMTVTNLVNGTLQYNWYIDGETLRTTLADKPDYLLVYSMREGCLIIEADGKGMVFGRQRVVTESYQPGDPVAAALLADFCGEWEAYYMSYQGLVLPFATTGMTITLAIGEDGATMADTEHGETTTLHYTLSFAEGTLTLTDGNATGHEFSILSLTLLTDGYLCYESEQGNIYFRPLAVATGGNPNAFTEAMAYYDAKEYDKAFPIFASLADAGHGEATAYLGKCYEKGHGVAADSSRALELYQLAAEQKVPLGIRALGDMYYYGNGVEQSAERAMELYREAAGMGYAPAMSAIGYLYETGNGVDADAAEAAQWYQRAADLGSDQGQYNLGLLYYKGSGVEQDVAKTVELFRAAAEQGHATAAYNLGYLYENGRGVEQSYIKASELYRQAADAGNANAQNNLAVFYYNGTGVEKDLQKAQALFELAAAQGHQNAIDVLAQYFDVTTEGD